MKTRFKDLSIGQRFMLTPYDPYVSEKISVDGYKCDISSTTYNLFKCKPDSQVIPLSKWRVK